MKAGTQSDAFLGQTVSLRSLIDKSNPTEYVQSWYPFEYSRLNTTLHACRELNVVGCGLPRDTAQQILKLQPHAPQCAGKHRAS